jgi:hypothetical protein
MKTKLSRQDQFLVNVMMINSQRKQEVLSSFKQLHLRCFPGNLNAHKRQKIEKEQLKCLAQK